MIEVYIGSGLHGLALLSKALADFQHKEPSDFLVKDHDH